MQAGLQTQETRLWIVSTQCIEVNVVICSCRRGKHWHLLLQATQNGSDLWLSYWVTHTHKERYEAVLLSANITFGSEPHSSMQWLSVGSVQSSFSPVSQCFLWAQPEPLFSAPMRTSSSIGREPASQKEEYREQRMHAPTLAPAAAEQDSRQGLRGRAMAEQQAAGIEEGLGQADSGGARKGLKDRWRALLEAAQRAWAERKQSLQELQPDVQLYLSVLLLLAVANSLFILVRSHVCYPHKDCTGTIKAAESDGSSLPGRICLHARHKTKCGDVRRSDFCF